MIYAGERLGKLRRSSSAKLWLRLAASMLFVALVPLGLSVLIVIPQLTGQWEQAEREKIGAARTMATLDVTRYLSNRRPEVIAAASSLGSANDVPAPDSSFPPVRRRGVLEGLVRLRPADYSWAAVVNGRGKVTDSSNRSLIGRRLPDASLRGSGAADWWMIDSWPAAASRHAILTSAAIPGTNRGAEDRDSSRVVVALAPDAFAGVLSAVSDADPSARVSLLHRIGPGLSAIASVAGASDSDVGPSGNTVRASFGEVGAGDVSYPAPGDETTRGGMAPVTTGSGDHQDLVALGPVEPRSAGLIAAVAVPAAAVDSRIASVRDTVFGVALPAVALALVMAGLIAREVVRRRIKSEEAIDKADAVVRAALEHEKRVTHAKSDFIGKLSHELRTPLMVIDGYTRRLQRIQDVGKNDHRAMESILAAQRHMAALVADSLDLTKIELGEVTFSPTRFDPAVVIDEMVGGLQTLAEGAGVEVSIEPVDDNVGWITTDATRFRQVLQNYISNAVTFTPRGGTVTVEARRDGDALRIGVSDTGCGILEADYDRVFDEFERAPTAHGGGTGLGLAVVKQVVEGQGGRVGVSAAPAGGCVFFAVLPGLDTPTGDGPVDRGPSPPTA